MARNRLEGGSVVRTTAGLLALILFSFALVAALNGRQPEFLVWGVTGVAFTGYALLARRVRIVWRPFLAEPDPAILFLKVALLMMFLLAGVLLAGQFLVK